MHDQQATAKKTWVKPELVVLARSNPEEAVLGACKNTTVSGTTAFVYGSCDQSGCSICAINTDS